MEVIAQYNIDILFTIIQFWYLLHKQKCNKIKNCTNECAKNIIIVVNIIIWYKQYQALFLFQINVSDIIITGYSFVDFEFIEVLNQRE